MDQLLSYFPGQRATIFLEITDLYGVRSDGYTTPIVERVILPTLTLATEYPQEMFLLDTGIYYYQFILPYGGAAVGSYLSDVSYTTPENIPRTKLYQILVNAPFGQFSATIG